MDSRDRLAQGFGLGVLGMIALAGCGSAGAGGDAGEDRMLEPPGDVVYEYGTAFGAVEEMLGDQVDLGFDDAGRLYILDPSSFRVLVVGPEGEFEREFGRQGEGPGEFSAPLGMVVEPDGSIAVLNGQARSFTKFDPQGEYVGDVRTAFGFAPAEMVPYPGGPGEVVFLGEGLDLSAILPGGMPTGQGRGAPTVVPTTPPEDLQGSGVVRPTGPPGGQGRGGRGGPGRGGDFDPFADVPLTIPIRKVSLADGASRVLHEAWRPQLPASEMEQLDGPGRGMARFFGSSAVGFLPQVQIGAFRDGRVAITDSSTYEIDIVGPSGEVQRTLGRPMEPRPVTEELIQMERDRRIAEIEAGESPMLQAMSGSSFMGGGDGRGPGGFGGFGEAAMTQMLVQIELEQMDRMMFAPDVPVIRRMAVDPGGRIWVERTPESLQGPGPIDLFDVDAGYLGTFEPGAVRIPDAFGPDGIAAFIERDEYDVPTIVVRRFGELIG